MTLFWIWVLYLFINILGFSVFLSEGRYLFTVKLFFRIVNGFVGFYMFQAYAADRESFRRLLIAFLIAGLFPMLMGMYQAATGHIWHMRTGTFGLVRNVGLYHNATSFRYFAYMTITALFLYWSYFSTRSVFQRILHLSYAAVCVVVLFNVYSKAAVATMALWLLIWGIVNRKVGFLFLCLVALLAANVVTGNLIFDQIAQVFLKETAVMEGTMDSELMLGGRFFGWKAALAAFGEAPLFNQLIGMGVGGGATHNDYLRALLASGVVGLLVYLLLLGSVGFFVTRNLIFARNPLNVMAFMIFTAYLIDTIGLNPGLYTGYQWYAWGFMGLAIHGVAGLDEERPGDVVEEPFSNIHEVSAFWNRHGTFGSRFHGRF